MEYNKEFTSSLTRARGLGSAKEGVGHWIWQRLCAIVMIPLSLWFVYSIIRLSQADAYNAIEDWFASPFNTILSVLLFAALFFHAKLGVQVVIEDYVHAKTPRNLSLIVINILFPLAGIISILSICKLHFFAL